MHNVCVACCSLLPICCPSCTAVSIRSSTVLWPKARRVPGAAAPVAWLPAASDVVGTVLLLLLPVTGASARQTRAFLLLPACVGTPPSWRHYLSRVGVWRSYPRIAWRIAARQPPTSNAIVVYIAAKYSLKQHRHWWYLQYTTERDLMTASVTDHRPLG